MLKALSFVRGAVARKDFLPVLTYFNIEAGRIIGSNGALALSSPIDLDLSATPRAQTFYTAISSCKSLVTISKLLSGNLSVVSAGFRANIECTSDHYPSIPVGGTRVDLPFPILPALKTLSKFISEDASRPWSQGIRFKDQSAMVTNNVVLAEYWLGIQVPVEVNIPTQAVDEILRIGEEPEYLEIRVDEETKATIALTVRYSGDRWLYTPCVADGWPDAARVLNREFDAKPFPDGLFAALAELKPFLQKDGACWLGSGHVRTLEDKTLGVAFDVAGLECEAKYSLAHFASLQGVATSIDLASKPAGWFGEGVRGVIMSMRQ